jgi:2-polyprenyl-3-methyl-5-hydroxy-6-metoxy-1,4-benzoquinol methylase
MDISPEAKTVLYILDNLAWKKKPSTLETIHSHENWKGKDGQSLKKILDQLVECDLLTRTETTYALTESGVTQMKHCLSEDFSDILIAVEQSVTSQKFCQRVYGRNLCQFNMTNETQLDKLLKVMNLSEDDHILDMGCGVGLISEYISDVTGARVTGIDFATSAIERALERTRGKKDRLSYMVMDMDELCFPEKSFSGVIAIDTLYFVKDLKSTIQSAKESLRENGQMGIFYSTKILDGESIEKLKPNQTPLAKVLKECKLNFQTWDFTEEEVNFWEKSLHVAEELKDEYDAEGTLQIYESTVSEAKSMLEIVRKDRSSRYLYHIQ